jgi:hypothetical protein
MKTSLGTLLRYGGDAFRTGGPSTGRVGGVTQARPSSLEFNPLDVGGGGDQALPGVGDEEEHPELREAASGLGVPGVIQAVVVEVKGVPPGVLGATGSATSPVAVTVAMTLLPWRSASAVQPWATLGKAGNGTFSGVESAPSSNPSPEILCWWCDRCIHVLVNKCVV